MTPYPAVLLTSLTLFFFSCAFAQPSTQPDAVAQAIRQATRAQGLGIQLGKVRDHRLDYGTLAWAPPRTPSAPALKLSAPPMAPADHGFHAQFDPLPGSLRSGRGLQQQFGKPLLHPMRDGTGAITLQPQHAH